MRESIEGIPIILRLSFGWGGNDNAISNFLLFKQTNLAAKAMLMPLIVRL
jgi:hypothetical protein